MNPKCPECGNNIRWKQFSSGGDGLYVCDKCGWVESCNTQFKEE